MPSVTKAYIIYWTGPLWHRLDPLKDLLAGNGYFTWRMNRDHDQPQGGEARLMAVHRDSGWDIVPAYGKDLHGVGLLIKPWLDSQLIKPDMSSLGKWQASKYRGLFATPRNLDEISGHLDLYNELIVELSDDDSVTPIAANPVSSNGYTHFKFADGGQVEEWNFNTISSPLHFWGSIQPHLLSRIQKIQHERFGPGATTPIVIGYEG